MVNEEEVKTGGKMTADKIVILKMSPTQNITIHQAGSFSFGTSLEVADNH